jgi:hypothetical protein
MRTSTSRALGRALAPATAVALALSLAACSGGGTDEDAAAGAAPAEEADGGSDGSDVSDGSDGSDVAVAEDDAVVGAVAADASDRHPGGSLLTVRQVEVRERSVALDVSFVNGRPEPVQLNGRRVWLVDDQGNGYEFSEPEQNSDLEVGAGAELSGTLVFLGVLDPAATELSLKANVFEPDETIDLTDRNRQDRSPQMQVSGLPLP